MACRPVEGRRAAAAERVFHSVTPPVTRVEVLIAGALAR